MIFQRGTLSPKTFAFWIYALSLIPSIFLTRYLERIGSPRLDPTTGTLISSGEDLSRPGILEWCFDVVYITCECTLYRLLRRRLTAICRGMPDRQWTPRNLVLVAISCCEFDVPIYHIVCSDSVV
jgi:hypothetical protein